MILEWNSVAKREFPLEWKTEWLVRERNVVSIIVLVPRGPRSFWTASLMKTDTVAFPEVSVLERVDCVFLLMTYNTHCRHQYQWNKQTKKKHPLASEWAPNNPRQSGYVVFLDHVKVEGVVDLTCLATSTATEIEAWTRTKLSNSVTVITNLR